MKRVLGVVALAIALCAIAAPAYAHVTVSAPGATPGGNDQQITFRVPVEEAHATVALTVALPTDTPIASVLVQPVPGWTHTEKTTTLAKPIKTDDGEITEAVSQITWKATPGHGLQPGEFGEFTIIAGHLPDVATIRFAAIQTYDNGSVVKWNQVAAPGSTAQPDNPAPVLTLSAGAAHPSTTTKSASTTGATVLSIVALIVAVAALGLAVVSRAKRAT